MQPAQKQRQQSCPEYCCCYCVQGLAFSAKTPLTAWLLDLLSVHPIKLCSSDIWNCYKWEMIFWVFQWETAKCLHLGALHTLDFLELAVTPTLSASYRKETECYCRIMQRKSIHFSQPHEHLFSNFPPSFFTYCRQRIQINDLAKILHSWNHNYVNLFLKAVFLFFVFT